MVCVCFFLGGGLLLNGFLPLVTSILKDDLTIEGTLACRACTRHAPGKVATITIPPSTFWGHVSIWDSLTYLAPWDLGTYFSAQKSKSKSKQ